MTRLSDEQVIHDERQVRSVDDLIETKRYDQYIVLDNGESRCFSTLRFLYEMEDGSLFLGFSDCSQAINPTEYGLTPYSDDYPLEAYRGKWKTNVYLILAEN